MPRPSVLVVDDVQDSREMLAEYLEWVGFRVDTASDAYEALTRAEEMRPDVVLMDLGLPGTMDGWEATRRVRAHPLLKATTVIAVTAHGFPEDRERALAAGCCSVVLKPYDLTDLVACVERAFAQSTTIGS
jgi:two-component system, cell cycle response regulator DivK